MSRLRATVITLLLVAAPALVACGYEQAPGAKSKQTSNTHTTPAAATPPAPTATPDPRPRVEGTWKLRFTPENAANASLRAIWRIKPKCATGPCSWTFRSSSGAKGIVTFDESLGEYRRRIKERAACVARTGEVVVKHAYDVQGWQELRVDRTEIREGVKVATRFQGVGVLSVRRTKKASLAGCSDLESPRMGMDPRRMVELDDRITAVRVR